MEKTNVAVEIMKQVLIGDLIAEIGAERIKDWLSNQKDQTVKSKSACIYRMCRSLNEIQKGQGNWKDFLAHLRQCILIFKQRLQLSEELMSIIEPYQFEFKLSLDKSFNEVNVLSIYPQWFIDDELKVLLDDLYNFKRRRIDNTVVGDGILHRMTGYTRYLSAEQKIIVQASMRLPEGHTLLACLPTGGGKSIVGQLAAFFETEGGQVSGRLEHAGSTVVVVPTVALAIDQAESVQEYFKDALDEKHKPYAYYSGIDISKRNFIIEGLKEGTIPLLYTSPEAILNGPLHDVMLHAAKNNRLNRLIIDEAHIVGSWGSVFRTEFQLLSPFRRKLIEYSNGRLKTILLSATITESTAGLLRDLFSEEGNLVEIRADQLRPEPIFCLDLNTSKEDRRAKLLELLPLLPRPLILYTTMIEDASEWQQILSDNGYRSIATFTGDTSDEQRFKLIQRWNSNQLDIMIATSAFGMGVDKQDIRTVIHACLPESIDRFYQEVGRGGRDGFPSLSILSVYEDFRSDVSDDFRVASSLISRILKTENILKRWFAMREQLLERVSGDEIWISVDVKPSHLEGKITGSHNSNWNEVALLFLYREGLIDIVDLRLNKETNRRDMLIKMLDVNLLSNEEVLELEIEKRRETEIQDKELEFERMKELVKLNLNHCWSRNFTSIYHHASRLCGGCPSCRKQSDFRPYNTVSKAYFRNKRVFQRQPIQIFTGRFPRYFTGSKELILYYKNQGEEVMELLKIFLECNSQNVILNDKDEGWLDFLPDDESLYYSFYQPKDILEEEGYIIQGVIVIYYPLDIQISESLYHWSRNYLEENEENKVIHVVPYGFRIESERRELRDLVDASFFDIGKVIQDHTYDWL